MSKLKTIYTCQQCGSNSSKWMGKCNNCGAWNTFVEEVVATKPATHTLTLGTKVQATLLHEVEAYDHQRLITSDKELNRVLGGGLVLGSVILLGGEPGVGKSTVLLQMALQTQGLKVLYVSGEESAQQTKLRASRIGMSNENVFILTETSLENIISTCDEIIPEIIIIDSIQTIQTAILESATGSVAQVRECAQMLQQYAKKNNIPIFLVGHITKEGSIAGPKVLEHLVDTVLQFEGDRNYNYRLLRTLKNRFGPTFELGIYEMSGSGLQVVENPSALLITQRDEPASGVAIATTMEGMRTMLIEVQALVSPAVYGTAQRSSTGYDLRRLNMLLAVLDKRCGFRFGNKDVFLNIAGGMRIEDPAADLAVVAALISSNEDLPLLEHGCFAAEVGLSGEVRPVNKIELRIAEAEKLGYRSIFISKFNTLENKKHKIKVIQLGKISDLFQKLFQ
jgi:DNA repair protein RadA/Sms